MATGQTIIDRALRYINSLAPGESAKAGESSIALEELNGILDGWSNEGLMQEGVTEVTHALTAGVYEYTIGASGAINTTKPVQITDIFVREGDNDYQVDLVNASTYSQLGLKSTPSSYPSLLYYEKSSPLGTVKLWPVPQSGLTLHFNVLSQISQLALTTTTINVGAGYETTLSLELADVLAPIYGRELSPSLRKRMVDGRGKIKAVNYQPIILDNDVPAGRKRSDWNIFSL